MDLEQLKSLALTHAVPILYKIGGALILWVIGRLAIGLVSRGVQAGLSRRKFDPTLTRYLMSVLGVSLTILLMLAMLSVFGIETTSFAAVLAAAGVAIGMAWSGLLANFAAGIFLVVLRPFKAGDMITAAGTTGVVHEIGLFATTLDTADNLRIFIGNNKLFGDNIVNYTLNPYRRVELKAQLANGVDPFAAMQLLRAALPGIPNVVAEPAPSVELLEFNLNGPVLAVRPFCHNDHYWGVYFATNETIQKTFAGAGYPAAENAVVMRGPRA